MANTFHSLLAQRTEEIFAPGGTLSGLVPSYAVNPRQIDYTKRAATVFGLPDPSPDQGGALAMLEGDTGTGKSLGYLVPLLLNAALTGERAIVSTHTNHLAQQLLNEDGPIAAEAVARLTGKVVSIARRIGRRNFVDLERVADVLKAMRQAKVPDEHVDAMAAWIAADPATFTDAAEEGLVLPPGVAEADICLLSSSTLAASAAYFAHVAESRDADILITNHSLSLINARCWSHVLDSAERPARLAVFDEADTLPQVARSMSESKLPFTTMRSLADELPASDAKDSLLSSLRALKNATEPMITSKSVVIEANEKAAPLLQAAENAGNALRAAAEASGDEVSRVALLEAAAEIDGWLKAAAGDAWEIAVLAASPVRSMPALLTVVADPAGVLSRLWRRYEGREPYLRAALLTSATLAAPSISGGRANFSDIMRELGISGGDNYASALSDSFAPDKFGKMSFVLADRDAPAPIVKDDDEAAETNPAFLDYVATGIEAARREGGRILVLASSYADAEALGSRVDGAIVHRRGTKLSALLVSYRADPHAILITPAAWAGVSLPGLVDHLVIPRVPYTAPDEARTAVLVQAMTRRGRSEAEARQIIRARALADARRRLRQGIGRGIRKPTDKCTLWLLDPRFPLPDVQVRNRRLRLHQGLANKHMGLISCIAVRFRVGVTPEFDRAGIHPVVSNNEQAA